MEKEFLVIIYVVNKFRHYITWYSTFVHIDHAAIRYLMNKPITPRRITRWLLLLQEFDITIIDQLGKDNIVANFMYRLNADNEGELVEDSFLDEHLFAISTNTPRYADIANYLATGKAPQRSSYSEQWRVIHHSAHYSWIVGYLFYTEGDQQILHCVAESDIFEVLKGAHDGPCGGNFADKQSGDKVLQMGYY